MIAVSGKMIDIRIQCIIRKQFAIKVKNIVFPVQSSGFIDTDLGGQLPFAQLFYKQSADVKICSIENNNLPAIPPPIATVVH